ncbi:hypothetical protein [Paracoccus aerodenitrificans]|uniref:hypothetical protein n=1 Tax=Paracoccus aerodenitrificans TaxID=3017781 RepID=UPI0022F0BD29|nr:hypothetical protein [Paracoccus aerodenitrificans]WBU64397.1 hypothetical protein PAE61_02830 [Paracoccus aerodenitrificans]
MTSFAESEKRLISALGRIDKALESLDARAAADPAPQTATPDDSSRSDARIAALISENAALKQRLAEAGAETVRLAQANEVLAAENAKLTSGQGDAEAALTAELEALKAARAAEEAALDEVMATLEAFIASAPRASDAPYAENVAPASGDVVSFDQNEG